MLVLQPLEGSMVLVVESFQLICMEPEVQCTKRATCSGKSSLQTIHYDQGTSRLKSTTNGVYPDHL